MDPAWFQKHKTELMIGGGGVAVTIALYMRSKAAKAGTSGSAVTSSYGNPATAVDTTTSDLYNNLSGQIQGLGTSVAALTASNQPKPIAVSDFSQEVKAGIGVYDPNASHYTDAAGQTYDVLQSPAQLQQALAAGKQPYFQPLAGTFQPFSDQGQADWGTQQLIKA